MNNQQTKKIQEDIKSLNISYLYCLRELARDDVGEASVRFGVEQSVAASIANASAEEIQSIANSSILQFKIRAPVQMRALLRKDDNEAPLRAAISMISETVENE